MTERHSFEAEGQLAKRIEMSGEEHHPSSFIFHKRCILTFDRAESELSQSLVAWGWGKCKNNKNKK